MNTALKNDSVRSQQPKRSGGYQTTNLFRLSSTAVDVDSVLRGLGNRLHKYDTPPPSLQPSIEKATSANRSSFYMEGEESRARRAVGGVTLKELTRFDYPLMEHQAHALFRENQRGGHHTRNNAKDEYAVKVNLSNK